MRILTLVSGRCLVAKAPALGAGNRRFESFRPDFTTLFPVKNAMMAMCLDDKQIAIFYAKILSLKGKGTNPTLFNVTDRVSTWTLIRIRDEIYG